MKQLSSPRSDIAERAGAIVVAYVASNAVPAAQLPALIHDVYRALLGLQDTPKISTSSPLPTAMQVAASVRPEAIVSFIDGRPYKALKRHLAANGLSPQRYRARYGLPADYPMIAPSYSARRSAIVRQIQ